MLTVLITTSGTGERLGCFTKYTNKSLVKVGDKYAICYIIDNYDSNTEFVITLGYYGNIVKEFLLLAYPNHNFIFVNVDKYIGEGSSLGYSLLCAKNYLQKPFIFHCCDTIIINKINIFPNMNTLYVYPCDNSSQYTTIIVENNNIKQINNKCHHEYDYAYVGIAYINNYIEFWKNLEILYNNNPNNSSLNDVESFKLMMFEQIDFKYNILDNWYDTGNLKSYKLSNKILNTKKYNVIEKNYESICFLDNVVIKYINDDNLNSKRWNRGNILHGLVPTLYGKTEHFIKMELIDGQLLSENNNYNSIIDLLEWSKKKLWINKDINSKYIEISYQFYFDKTINRIKQLSFLFDEKMCINRLKCKKTILETISSIPRDLLITDTFYNFHGDFILDNIIKKNNNEYVLLDWRYDFGDCDTHGDIYYDLAKLRHNIIFNHANVINKLYFIHYANESVTLDIKTNYILIKQLEDFDNFVIVNNFDIYKIKIIMSIIWLNMSPLYEGELSEFLFYFGKYNLEIILNENA